MHTPEPMGIITPLHQRLGICKSCGHRLGFFEKRKMAPDGKIRCKRCGAVFYDRRITY